MEFELLETDRLWLRKITPEMFKFIFANYSMEDASKLLGLTPENYATEKRKSDGGYTTYDRTIVQFKLVVKETGAVIGACGFHNWYALHMRAELGYALTDESSKRNGYMTEAVTAVLDYGFNTMKLERVEACVGPDNIPSRRLIEKNGFTREGLLRRHYFHEGELHDSLIFGLLREEYFAARRNLQF